MRKKILAGLAAGVLLIGMSGKALAVLSPPFDELGELDTFMESTALPNSNDATELEWLQSVLGGEYVITDKYDDVLEDWFYVQGNQYAYELKDSPTHYLIKTGNLLWPTSDPDPTHFLFINNDSKSWAYLDFTTSFTYPIQILKISHINEISPAPEPAVMLLFSTGVAGLAGMIRRRKTFKESSL